MTKTKFLLTAMVLLMQLSINAQSPYKSNKFKKIVPPGTAIISDGMYTDINEMSNIGYREFLYWKMRVYGKNSEAVKEILPDTAVWQELPFENEYSEHYFRKAAYNNFPVVGVSLIQAKEYANWRTDRVAEMILIENGHIKMVTEGVTPENHFTIQRYSEGDFDWIIKRKDYKFPHYKIPDEEEWIKLAAGNSEYQYGLKVNSKFNKKVLKKRGHYFNSKEYLLSKQNQNEANSNALIYLTTPERSFLSNIYGLFDVYGNVSEMIDKPLVSKGGSWMNEINEIKPDSKFLFEKPNCFTGFRCVAYWE